MILRFPRLWSLAAALSLTACLLLAAAPGARGSPAVRGDGNAVLAPPPAAEVAAREALARELATHVTVLTSPFFEGRTPGTAGSARAKDYAEHFLSRSGLEPAFGASYRQDFDLAGPIRVLGQEFTAGELSFAGAREFTALGLGRSGAVQGPVVFAGYAIASGPDGYTSFPEGSDLTGAVALVMRFEPRDERGRSRWTQNGQWSGRAALEAKVRACVERGAVAVCIANPPGAADPRARGLMDPSDGGRGGARVPVLHMTADAAARLVAQGGFDWSALAVAADEGGGLLPLGLEARLDVQLERTRIAAQNLGAWLAGSGALAEEVVVVGAHLDHVGNGQFASPDEGGALHPGADDNASGSAVLLTLAARLGAQLAASDPEEPRRSLLFLLFDAEESGLLGSRHYVGAPIRPIANHSLMINLDMVGRMAGGRATLQGGKSAEGLEDWLAPFLSSSGLEVRPSRQVSARSDHASFLEAGVPSLFFTNADGHPDYHRPSDTPEKVEALPMADLVLLLERLVPAAARRPEPFVHVPTPTSTQPR